MYLLLRNNKQSGPYSIEELKSMGLKAYDLVWLEGKSAAWRYPSELEELKAFAPAVEEQPFDRFYRKPAPAATTITNPSGVTLTTKAPAADTPIPVTVESSKAPGKRIIYVTMPAARNTSSTLSQREPVQPVREIVRPVHEPVQPVREPDPVFHEDPIATTEPIRPIQTRPRVIEDYSAHQAGDEGVVEEYFPRKKRSPHLIRMLTIAICILALLAVGIIIGLNLKKNTLGLPSGEVARLHPVTRSLPSVNPDQTIVHPTAQQLPSPAATAPALPNDPAKAAGTAPSMVEQPNTTYPAATRSTPRTTPATSRMLPGPKSPKDRSLHPVTHPGSLATAKDSADKAAVTNAVQRADIAEPYHSNSDLADKEAIKAALASQVSVGANGYSVGTFGGITDLQLTVTNRSAYPLDQVIVEVQYIQANKKVFKTEELYFRGIGAGSALMQEAPRSSRGVRIHCKIMSITSKEVAYSYSGI